MITINDTDLPITVANKIITGTKPLNPTPISRMLARAIIGNDFDCETTDMFSNEEIKEIADYLMVFYESHKEGE